MFDQFWQVIPLYIPKKRLLMDDSLQESQLRCINPRQGSGTCLRWGGCWLKCRREWQVNSRSWVWDIHRYSIFCSYHYNIVQKSFTFLKLLMILLKEFKRSLGFLGITMTFAIQGCEAFRFSDSKRFQISKMYATYEFSQFPIGFFHVLSTIISINIYNH